MELALGVLVVVGVLEAGVAGLVWWLRQSCQWLITPRDLTPPIDKDGLKKFLDHGWDAELGWVRKPNTAHDEGGGEGKRTTRFHIGPDGARINPGFEDRQPEILVYGDSYGFSREVNDDETWTHKLSELLDKNVANRAVGNYGMDQALLRFERECDDHSPSLVVMAVVPETMCRLLSVWKHFSEYGNTFAFKPRFVLDGERLDLLPNPVDSPEKFLAIADLLPTLKRRDFFYGRKFSKDMLRFPYLWSLARSWRRNLPLMRAALLDRIGPDRKRSFVQVMKRNIALTADIYAQPHALSLFEAVCLRFRDRVEARGATPLLAIFPQLLDLDHIAAYGNFYETALRRLDGKLAVVDLTPDFLAAGDDETLFVHDGYGGHLSPQGNAMVAERLADVCRELAGPPELQRVDVRQS